MSVKIPFEALTVRQCIANGRCRGWFFATVSAQYHLKEYADQVGMSIKHVLRVILGTTSLSQLDTMLVGEALYRIEMWGPPVYPEEKEDFSEEPIVPAESDDID